MRSLGLIEIIKSSLALDWRVIVKRVPWLYDCQLGARTSEPSDTPQFLKLFQRLKNDGACAADDLFSTTLCSIELVSLDQLQSAQHHMPSQFENVFRSVS